VLEGFAQDYHLVAWYLDIEDTVSGRLLNLSSIIEHTTHALWFAQRLLPSLQIVRLL
jgi:hypothetical protein